MVSNRVQSIIASMAQFSATASDLVARLGIEVSAADTEASPVRTVHTADRPQDILAVLQQQVRELQLQVHDLETELSEPADAQFTDEEQTAFVRRTTDNLMQQPYNAMLEFYNKEFFRSLPRNARLIVANCLCNVCTKRSFAPASLWSSLTANNGNML